MRQNGFSGLRKGVTFFCFKRYHVRYPVLFSKKLFLLFQKDGFDTLFQQKVELFRVIAQIFIKDRIDACSINVNLKLLPVKSLCRMHCLRKSRFERKALCLCQICSAFNFRAVQNKV